MPKIPNVPYHLIKKIHNPSSPQIRVWCRNATIVTSMIGLTIEVHNGKIFNIVRISEEMVGHKLGEFSPTRPMRKIHNSSKSK